MRRAASGEINPFSTSNRSSRFSILAVTSTFPINVIPIDSSLFYRPIVRTCWLAVDVQLDFDVTLDRVNRHLGWMRCRYRLGMSPRRKPESSSGSSRFSSNGNHSPVDSSRIAASVIPLQIHPRIAPDQSVVFVGESMAVPLADSADRVAQGRTDRVDRVFGFGMADDGFGVDADRVDCADRFEVFTQPANRRRRTAGLEAIDELGDLFGTQRIGADRVALDRRPDVLQDAELAPMAR